MQIYFIGAGPGDPELLTIKAKRIINSCDVLLYAGSLIPKSIVELASKAVRVVDTAQLSLEEIATEFLNAQRQDQTIARLQSGDLTIYSAIAEQINICQKNNIPWQMIPGVPAFSAAAARLGCEFTQPRLCQTIILTRFAGKASPMPDNETLTNLAKLKTTLIIHLAIASLAVIVRRLIPILGADYPVAVVYAVGWPEETVIRANLATIRAKVKQHKITRQALIILGQVLAADSSYSSSLYDPEYKHLFRDAAVKST